MSQYKIKFSGFAFIEAESAEEARKKFWENEEGYSEFYIDSCEEDEA